MIANTTGCSSIWGASAPVTPYTTNDKGQGPAWSNSLFEDNAEYGFGMYIANQVKRKRVVRKAQRILAEQIGSDETQNLLKDWIDHKDEGEGSQQRAAKLTSALEAEGQKPLQSLLKDQAMFAKPSQWLIGGDGWAYDIGFAGIDHVLASGEDINILVMDNELYANTGGQMSKATPTSATAKFAAGGKKTAKKDLGMMAATYGNVYVAQVSIEANPTQTIKAITEAEKYQGPSLIIGYTPCINHGLRGGMQNSIKESKDAVESGYWQLYRYDPRQAAKGKNPLRLDYKRADFDKIPDLLKTQNRFTALQKNKNDPAFVSEMFDQTKKDMKQRAGNYERMTQMNKIKKK
ncbi:MAG: thiamine pyrophosphate-dependent enzyme, partial [Tetragenococcus koreensis]